MMLSNNPITLSLELSQREGFISISNNEGNTVSCSVSVGRRDKDDLMPSIANAANQLGISPEQIELVVVSVGPGGFTSLRTSVAIAKMIAFSTGAKLVPVESPIVVAKASRRGDGPFLIISSVKKESFWLSRVLFLENKWLCESRLSTTDELESGLDNIVCVFADSFLSDCARTILQGHNIPIHPPTVNGISLMEVGVKLYLDGASITPHAILPIYPREPEAVSKWNSSQPKFR